MSVLQVHLQESNEIRFSRKHIDQKIRKEIQSNPDMMEKVAHGVRLINEYRSKQYYASKNTRIAQLSGMDMGKVVLDLFVGISYSQQEELFTSVTGQLAGRLQFDDKKEAITTVAELVAVLALTDAFDIVKADKFASLMIQSCIPLSKELIGYINNSLYLPPMVCQPLELNSNYNNGHLTHNDSLILGKGNHHDGDICLDVLNTMNSVALKLDNQFLSTVEETPKHDLETDDQREQWKQFKEQSYMFYKLMVKQGNQFWFTHKVDKRGRIYAQGYQITTQGSSFKKASVELMNEELVNGVP